MEKLFKMDKRILFGKGERFTTITKSDYEMAISSLEKIDEYKNLESKGLFIKLPCCVGDKIYLKVYQKFAGSNKIVRGKVDYFTILENDISFRVSFGHDEFTCLLCSDEGELWFLSREEAERVLNGE